jgi:isoquinoline 1-oxidoreductase alpha subunit
MASLNLNGKKVNVDVPDDTPLLWIVRDHLNMTGTKFGCGAGLCGACTVHLDGAPARSCQTTLAQVAGRKVTTIEGVGGNKVATAVQAAWDRMQVPQCGYCQSGQVMAATALLTKTPSPTDEQINQAMTGNICRCGTYGRIRAAIKDASKQLGGKA